MNNKVLVVDDEQIIRTVLRTLLVKWGYRVSEASDGEQAIEQMLKGNFDLIICDILMPKKDGWQVVQEVRANPKTKNIPIILLTAKNEDPDTLKGYDLGANYYLTKPFTKDQLQYGIELMLGKNPFP